MRLPLVRVVLHFNKTRFSLCPKRKPKGKPKGNPCHFGGGPLKTGHSHVSLFQGLNHLSVESPRFAHPPRFQVAAIKSEANAYVIAVAPRHREALRTKPLDLHTMRAFRRGNAVDARNPAPLWEITVCVICRGIIIPAFLRCTVSNRT